jgi:AraC-like DNA-binding protein
MWAAERRSTLDRCMRDAFNARAMNHTAAAVSSFVPTTEFDTAQFAAHDQFDAWRERISVIFNVDPLDTPTAEGFPAMTQGFHLGDLILTRSRFEAQRFVRTALRARSDMLDHYLVQLYTEGGYRGRVDEREIEVRAGTVSILDLTRATETYASAGECLSIVMPRDMLDPLLPAGANLHGFVLDAGNSRLFSTYFLSLFRQMPTTEVSQVPYIVRATCNLLAACVRPGLSQGERTEAQKGAGCLQDVRMYVERGLSSPDLSPEDICAALDLSRTQLYELFQSSGGVRRYIQQRRLIRIHSALSDPTEIASIAELALRFGFTSHAHFSRAFREYFDYSPSDVRRDPTIALRSRLQPSAEGARNVYFDDWIRLLRG